MAFGLDPLVRGSRGRDKALIVVFVSSMVIAASSVGAILGSLGSWFITKPNLLLLAAVGLMGVLLESRVLSIRPPYRNWLVPRDWPQRYGLFRGYSLWGTVLGLGVTSYVPFASYHVYLLCVLLSGSGSVGAAAGASYGIARAMGSLIPATMAARHPSERRDRATAALDREGTYRGVQVAALLILTISLGMGASIGIGG